MSSRATPSAGRQCDVLSAIQRGDQAAAHNLILNSPGLNWHAILDGRYCPSLVPPHREAGGAVAGLSVARAKPGGVLTMTPKRQGKKAA